MNPLRNLFTGHFFNNGGTDEICLEKEGYDAKIASRLMHIEPVELEAVCWIEGDSRNTENIKQHNQCIYCLFDYEHKMR